MTINNIPTSPIRVRIVTDFSLNMFKKFTERDEFDTLLYNGVPRIPPHCIIVINLHFAAVRAAFGVNLSCSKQARARFSSVKWLSLNNYLALYQSA